VARHRPCRFAGLPAAAARAAGDSDAAPPLFRAVKLVPMRYSELAARGGGPPGKLLLRQCANRWQRREAPWD
jgi:hypothetical protein